MAWTVALQRYKEACLVVRRKRRSSAGCHVMKMGGHIECVHFQAGALGFWGSLGSTNLSSQQLISNDASSLAREAVEVQFSIFRFNCHLTYQRQVASNPKGMIIVFLYASQQTASANVAPSTSKPRSSYQVKLMQARSSVRCDARDSASSNHGGPDKRPRTYP